jgi:hypothetical protein
MIHIMPGLTGTVSRRGTFAHVAAGWVSDFGRKKGMPLSGIKCSSIFHKCPMFYPCFTHVLPLISENLAAFMAQFPVFFHGSHGPHGSSWLAGSGRKTSPRSQWKSPPGLSENWSVGHLGYLGRCWSIWKWESPESQAWKADHHFPQIAIDID